LPYPEFVLALTPEQLALLGAVVVVAVIGAVTGIGDHLDQQLMGLRNGPWGLPMTVLLFIVTSFLAAPQFVLFAAAVVAFGPWLGCAYAMIGTIVAAWIHFIIGRLGGAKLVERYGGNTINRLSRFIGRNDFLASLIVRSVPTAPAVIVNMAFGATRASFPAFLTGCALGVLPKTALVAFFGGAVVSAVSGDGVWTSLILAGVAFVWLGLMLGVRELVKRRERASGAD
jgi:uncharacterized membrane protein YdjX (TVP38/TMEM64 family)